MIATWPAPTGKPELALVFDQGRTARLLVLPALFDEANKLRHFTVELLHLLDQGGVDCLLPDLPGCNESTQALEGQTVVQWQAAALAAARHFGATHVLAIRGGALLAPPLPGWRYAAVTGESQLRALLRARVLGSKEAGLTETRDNLLDQGRQAGLELAGYRLGAGMIAGLEAAQPADLVDISQGQLGGAGLWLRAEPDHNPEQVAALAALVLSDLSA